MPTTLIDGKRYRVWVTLFCKGSETDSCINKTIFMFDVSCVMFQ